MHIVYTLQVTVVTGLLIAYAAVAADLEIDGAENKGTNAAILRSNSSVIEKLDPITVSRKKDVHLDDNSSSNQMKSKEAGNQRKMSNSIAENKSKDSSAKEGEDGKGLREGEQLEKANNSRSEEQGEKEKILRHGVQSREEVLSTRKESFHGEECDSSYSCTIEEKAVVACLRVPGNESPDLSLLVQNKGKDTASILILAPKFVQLEQNKIELQGKENKKMKVSIKNAGNDNVIILKAGDGQCALDFKGLNDNADKTSQFKYVFPSFGIMCLIAIALVATILIYIKRRLLVSNSGHKYQKLDAGLPVSSGVKVETLSTDGWDNGWDDNWDDEEAAPITPSLSSKGISLRQSSKEGWKD